MCDVRDCIGATCMKRGLGRVTRDRNSLHFKRKKIRVKNLYFSRFKFKL